MAQNAITDEQYGALHRKLDDFLRRVKEGTCLSFKDAMDIIQTTIDGQGFRRSREAAAEMSQFGFLTEEQCIVAQNLLSRGFGEPGGQGNFTKVTPGNLIVASFEFQQSDWNEIEGKFVITGRYYEDLPTIDDIKVYAGNATLVSFYHYPESACINAPKGQVSHNVELIAYCYRDDKRPRWVFILESGAVIAFN